MRFADRTLGLMDGMMGSEVRERMRVQIWWLGGGRKKKNSSSFPAELNLGLGCSTLPCLSSHRALCSGPQPASRMASEAPPPPPLTFWLSLSLFPLFISSFLSPPPLLLLALTHFTVFLPSLFLSAFFLTPPSIFRWHGGVAGPDRSLGVSIAILCVLMSLVLTMRC